MKVSVSPLNFLASSAVMLPLISTPSNAQPSDTKPLESGFELFIPQAQTPSLTTSSTPAADAALFDAMIEGTGPKAPDGYVDINPDRSLRIYSETRGAVLLEGDASKSKDLQSLGFGALSGPRTIYRRRIGNWEDIFSWQVRTECVKWAWGKWPWGGEWKTCVGHKYQRRHIVRDVDLVISLATPKDLEGTVVTCLQTAAVVTALEGIGELLLTSGASGFTGAFATFTATMEKCVEYKLKTSVVSIKVEPHTRGWGEWK